MASRIVLIVGALLIVFMGMFPPWRYIYKHPRLPVVERSAGYRFILLPPEPTNDELGRILGRTANASFASVSIETGRLAIQIAAVLLACGLLAFALRPKAPAHNTKNLEIAEPREDS